VPCKQQVRTTILTARVQSGNNTTAL